MPFRTLDSLDAQGKRVLLRADLNVPVRDGKITDLTRIERLSPTIRELSDKGAKVIVCSHFDRPKGKRVPEMSLAPMAAALGQVLGRHVRFVEDCIGVPAEGAVDLLSQAACWCWKTPATTPVRKRTIPPSPPPWRNWPTSSSTMRSRPPTERMPAPRAWRICCRLMPAG